jgi:AcrR family transcriptional regulator
MSSSKDAVRSRILSAAVRAIDAGGEAALRVVAVCEAAGVTQGMVRYYFGGRDGLLAEAKAVRFGQRFGEFLDDLEVAVQRCSTRDELRAVIDGVVSQVFSVERSPKRLERNIDVGGTLGHPMLAAQIAAARDAGCRQLAGIFGAAQDRGLISGGVDLVVFSAVYYAFVHGYSLWELGEETVDRAAIVEMFKKALVDMLFD